MVVEYKDNPSFPKCSLYKSLKDIFLRKDGKNLKIKYLYNGNFYFDIYGEKRVNENGFETISFEIEEEDESYDLFRKLVSDIRECQIFEADAIELELCLTEDERKVLVEKNNEKNKELINGSSYQKLVGEREIIWFSDSIYDERANCLVIRLEDNKIILEFISNPGDPDYGFSIRIDNHGSKYDPFNICFMRLYNSFQELSREKKLMREKRTE